MLDANARSDWWKISIGGARLTVWPVPQRSVIFCSAPPVHSTAEYGPTGHWFRRWTVILSGDWLALALASVAVSRLDLCACTEWSIWSQHTVCWHQIKSSSIVITSYTKAQLLFQCQQKVVHDQMDHSVHVVIIVHVKNHILTLELNSTDFANNWQMSISIMAHIMVRWFHIRYLLQWSLLVRSTNVRSFRM